MEEKGTKLFIGGVSWETTDVAFSNFFSRFGEVKDAVIMRDSMTGRSRGFGFVTFADPASADKVLATTPLELDGRTMDPKPAVPKEQMSRGGGSGESGATPVKKLFIGGLSPDTQQSEFQEYFAQFGSVQDAIIMMDNNTGRPRGFGFVTFDTVEAAEKVMAAGSHIITNKQVECKRAVPKSQSIPTRSRGGYGGGRGGYGMRAPPGPGYGPPPAAYGGYPAYGGYGGGYGGYGGYGQAPPPNPYAPADDGYGGGRGGYDAYPPANGYGAQSSYGAYSRNTRTDRSYHPYSR